MYSIFVKDEFYDSSIVQGLRLQFSTNYQFVSSLEIDVDVAFPFCSNLAFVIMYTDDLNKEGINRIQAISNKNSNFILIISISPTESSLYERFLCDISRDIRAVVCFPNDNFQKSASSFIFKTVNQIKESKNEIENLLKHKKRENLNPDIQASAIFSNLIKPVEVKNKILAMMKADTGTIRKTMIKGLPELFKCDFYMESDDSD